MSKSLIESNILEYLSQHENKELLRFITCGSVDDGKSTLIGRLLYESKMVFEDQLMALKAEAKYKRTEDEIDFSLLVDGLQAEREQGITIDVAYRYFSTDKRKFIIADTPGHEQYTRNMATGASNADVAVILIDARNGVLTQTRRHSFIVTLMGIKHLVVAINKMDLVGYSKDIYEKIVRDYKKMFECLKYLLPFKTFESDIEFIPISALKGDNVVKPSKNMPWYKGKTLLDYLDTVKIQNSKSKIQNFRFPVQYVNRPNHYFRGYCGTIVSGKIRVGDEITVLNSKIKTKVKAIIPPAYEEPKDNLLGIQNRYINNIFEAFAPMAITIITEDEIDISRGDMLVKSDDLPNISDTIDAYIVWFGDEPLEIGKNYEVKSVSRYISGYIDEIYFKININTLEKEKSERLIMNEIGYCRIVLNTEIPFDNYWVNRDTGSMIFIDKITHNTVGCGMLIKPSYEDNNRLFNERLKRGKYSEFEIELNRLIRKYFPEWGCKSIE
ncbi:sulfate adenylyltransferase subunit CysN [Deferribacter thermophilus]|uniref:sulfate adenylyltransferase subunit CysN n=1 Tax=Deferribacter thermophilus TaxID=53573 RepID=UPI003C231E11